MNGRRRNPIVVIDNGTQVVNDGTNPLLRLEVCDSEDGWTVTVTRMLVPASEHLTLVHSPTYGDETWWMDWADDVDEDLLVNVVNEVVEALGKGARASEAAQHANTLLCDARIAASI